MWSNSVKLSLTGAINPNDHALQAQCIAVYICGVPKLIVVFFVKFVRLLFCWNPALIFFLCRFFFSAKQLILPKIVNLLLFTVSGLHVFCLEWLSFILDSFCRDLEAFYELPSR